MATINDILKTAMDNKASDIHIMVGQPPLIRMHTQMTPTDFPVVTAESTMRMLKEISERKAHRSVHGKTRCGFFL